MKPTPAPDHNRAAVMLFSVVALNTHSKSGYTINRKEAAQVLATLLQIDRSAPLSWLRGDFRKHPLSHVNFMKIVQAYRTKPGLESDGEVMDLAMHLYGFEQHKALDLINLPYLNGGHRPEKNEMVRAIFDLIASSSAEKVKDALMQLMD